MPDIENAAQLVAAVQRDRMTEDAVATPLTAIYDHNGNYRHGYQEVAPIRELLLLRRDRRDAGRHNPTKFDFELRESQIHFRQIKFALDRAAERERFR